MASNKAIEVYPWGDEKGDILLKRLRWWRLVTQRIINVAITPTTPTPLQHNPIAIVIISLLTNDLCPQRYKNNLTNKIILTRLNFDHNPATNKTINIYHSSITYRYLCYVQKVKFIKTEGYWLAVRCACIEH